MENTGNAKDGKGEIVNSPLVIVVIRLLLLIQSKPALHGFAFIVTRRLHIQSLFLIFNGLLKIASFSKSCRQSIYTRPILPI